MRVKLRVSEKGKASYMALLSGDSAVIGRDRKSDLRLEHNAISRRHARLWCDREGRVFLGDLESRNGISLNDYPLDRPQLVRQGDEIHLGPIALIVLELEINAGEATDDAIVIRKSAAAADSRESTRGLSDRSKPPRAPVRARVEWRPEMEPEATAASRSTDEAPIPVETPAHEPARGPLAPMSRVEAWTHSYSSAMETIDAEYEKLWQSVRSRTPATLAGEMLQKHEAVAAALARLRRVAEGIEESCARVGSLLEASRTIGAPSPLRERLEKILDLAIEKLKADCGFLMLYSRRRKNLSLAIQRGMADLAADTEIGEGDPPPPRPSVSLAHRALQSGAMVFVRDSAVEAEDPRGDTLVSRGIRAAICAPMAVEGRLVGLVYVDYRKQSLSKNVAPTQEDAEWLESLGLLAALAIENARLIEKSKKANTGN